MATRSSPLLTLTGARIALHACEAKATELKIDMNIAIVDASTHLLAFSRMPGAKITSINIAIDKAFTAAGHRLPTHLYKEAVWPGGPAFGLGNSNGGRFVTIGGGLPVVDGEGRVVGAVGVSTVSLFLFSISFLLLWMGRDGMRWRVVYEVKEVCLSQVYVR